MKYSDLLNSHLKYGTKNEDIIKTHNYEGILENVVIAPWWTHDMFESLDFRVEKISDILFNFYNNETSFSFLELKRIGAPNTMEYILALGVTKCKNIIFIR